MSHSVNYLLSMEKNLRTRLNQLNELKMSCSKETYWRTESKEEKPTYDIKKVDAKIVAINKTLFTIDHKIKESNAKTLIEIEIDYDTLVGAIE